MTATQINYIIELLNYSSEVAANRMGYAPLVNNYFIDISENEKLYSNIAKYRFKFDSTNNILTRTQVRVYSYDSTKVPSHGNYDIYSDDDHEVIVYEYMIDDRGVIMKDYYNYTGIVLFVPLAGKISAGN